MLYFKYLLAKNPIKKDRAIGYKRVKNSGKILYIDDEWAKGWSDILSKQFSQSTDMDLKTFEYGYKDANKFIMLGDIKREIESYDPDVIILDLRLMQTDHNKIEDIDQYSGIKIVNMIKEINPGMQIIMMTATRQSVILEKLYDYGVLGYIKKEHPDDLSVKTNENIDKLFSLVEAGLDRKYLKDIFNTAQAILKLISNSKDPFEKFVAKKNDYEKYVNLLIKEVEYVFNLLQH